LTHVHWLWDQSTQGRGEGSAEGSAGEGPAAAL